MGGYSNTYSDLYDPAFPQSPLDARTELLLGGVWTDISTKVYYRAGVTISRGHPDESSAITPGSCGLTLNNRGGPFSPMNPLGTYYGLIGANTPLRYSVPEGSVYLRLEDDTTSYASCPDNARLHITGDIDVRIDIRPSNYTKMVLAGKWAPPQCSWILEADTDGTLTFFWSPDGTSFPAVVSTVPIPLGRIAVRATLSVATGTVTFYTAPSISGTWTQLGAAASGTSGASTSVFASNTPIQLGYNANVSAVALQGKIYAFQLRSGIGGALAASPDFTTQVPGVATFADAQSNIWTLNGTAKISDRAYRHHGEVTAWPPEWDVTGTDVSAPIQSNGLMRRLGGGSGSGAPLNSALYRAYVRETGSTAPAAYWPCEDGALSTQLASAIGGIPMTIRGTPTLASDSSFLCSASLPVVAKSVWTGTVPAVTTSANTFHFLMKVTSASAPADGTVIARLFTRGTVARTDLIYRTGGNLQLTGYNTAGAQLFDTGSVLGFGFLDQGVRAGIELQPSGGNVQCSMGTLVPGAAAASVFGTTVAGTIGAAYQVQIGPNADLDQVVVGHVSVQPVYDTLFNLGDPLNAWQGENAAFRFARLCTEEGVASRVYGHPADTVAMGPQRPLKLTDLLQQCEDADKGLIYEPRQTLALGYRTRASMLNQAPVVTLDYAAAHLSPPIKPTDDDQFLVNDMTVTRTNSGSSSRQVLASGTKSIQAPPNGVGLYPSSVSVNLNSDTQLADAAGWLVHLGTVADLRYPSLAVQLTRSELAALFYQVQDAEIGDRIVVANPPSWLPPDSISQILRGMHESPYTFTYDITWVCAPEAPYRVGVYDDPVLGRYDTDGSQVWVGVSSTATSMQVATTNPNSPLWTTNAGDFPFDIAVGAERMTVTNITGATSPQLFTVTRSVNGVVKQQTSGTDVRLLQPAVYSM